MRNQLETPVVIAQQFRWAFGELDTELAFWIGPDRKRFEATDERRLTLRDTLASAEVLILTLGLAEFWYDRFTREPLWRVPPRWLSGSNRFAFKVASVAESVAALETIHRIRSTHMPAQKIIYTVSPQRNAATFRGISPLVANTVSKAVLRVAVDEFLAAHAEELNRTYFYFPGYEIVMELLRDPFEDNMHLRDHHAAYVLDLFARYYVEGAMPAGEAPPFPASAEDELLETISIRDVQNATLQAVCDERLEEINRLSAACDERLEVINTLSAACDARLAEIERLEGELERLRTRSSPEMSQLAAGGQRGAGALGVDSAPP